jgi:cyclopropane-fatty-acyl-phospholipid synthase
VAQTRPVSLAPAPAFELGLLARELVVPALAGLPEQRGTLTLIERDRSSRFCSGEPHAALVVHDPGLWLDLLLGGSAGCGEAFVAGRWSSDDVTGLCRLLLRNAELLASFDRGWFRARRTLDAMAHLFRRFSPRRNIARHYDLGNDFFELVLDPTLSYSAALFEPEGVSLEQASRKKNARVLSALGLEPGRHLLEIGTGWGALAEQAAASCGVRVTTTTLSRGQHQYACRRMSAAGLGQRVRVLERDFRELRGRYDALACIEMIEAIGYASYPAFFRKCRELLQPGGRMLLQAIVIGDDRFEWAKHRVDFVKKHVFPGSCLPSRAVLAREAARAGFVTLELFDITEHYPPTLRAWRERLHENAGAIRRLGYSESLIRSFHYYLSYCEAGFVERHIGDVQILLERRR